MSAIDNDYAAALRASVDAGHPVGRVARVTQDDLRPIAGTSLLWLPTIITEFNESSADYLVRVQGPAGFRNRGIFSREEIRDYMKSWIGSDPDSLEGYGIQGNPVMAFYEDQGLQGLSFLKHSLIVPPTTGNMGIRSLEKIMHISNPKPF
jgi:hypothetical protein